MAKKKNENHYDEKLIDALKKIPSPIWDKKHKIFIYLNNDQARSNESRFEHIAKKNHELKVRDIEAIADGINGYVSFYKSHELKDTYYYFINRKGNPKGFIQVAIKLIEGETNKYYVKTIYIAYRIKYL